MKHFLTLTCAFLATVPLAAAKDELHRLSIHRPKAGQTVVTKSISDSSGGKISIKRGDTTLQGDISVKRERTFETRLQAQQPAKQISYKILSDRTVTLLELGGQKDNKTQTGGLVGHSATGVQDETGHWRLYMKGATATQKQAVELAEYEAYENRKWFPETPIAVGQTWGIDPGFIRHLVERDVDHASTKATLTFQSVEMIDNEKTAVLLIDIKTGGTRDKDVAQRTASASAAMKGLIHVSLDTMLDKKLVLKGSLTTSATEHGQTTTITLPVNYLVTKTLR